MSDKGGSNSGDVFDVRRVRRFVELMQEHELAEIDLRDGERRIRLRSDRDVPMQFAGSPAAQLATAPPTTITPDGPTPPVADPPPPPANETFITSPMVGTFYSSANPESPPFVKVGDRIGPDTVVCIVEAMKVFNEIPAETSGKITAVLVENGESVEYGQQLFKIEAS